MSHVAELPDFNFIISAVAGLMVILPDEPGLTGFTSTLPLHASCLTLTPFHHVLLIQEKIVKREEE